MRGKFRRLMFSRIGRSSRRRRKNTSPYFNMMGQQSGNQFRARMMYDLQTKGVWRRK